MRVVFWLKTLNERYTLENTGMKESIIFKLMLRKYDEGNGMFVTGITITRIFCFKKFLEF
jgi:hypothetical protein